MIGVFHDWRDFWLMGGYAFYVWLAVLSTVIPLCLIIGHTLWQHRALLVAVRRQRANEGRRHSSRSKHRAEEYR
ncbi:TPA: heme exporter protein CcmD [Enterobacter hormaechei subsp. steigerwaltii]|nr:heme exporter protein CcmD [Enterobacter hormaechei subsp. steigerwaltii]